MAGRPEALVVIASRLGQAYLALDVAVAIPLWVDEGKKSPVKVRVNVHR